VVDLVDLKQYEQAKFRLAEIVRAASLAEAKRSGATDERWRSLLTRLAEDRFNVVVAGRFSQGKSTLMNALLGMDRLPTGLVPITSVITTVRYGTSERVTLEYLSGRLPGTAPLSDLARFVTEAANPGNTLGIRSAEIELPAQILRRGFFFVDTPGLGSAILANTATTERFASEIDVLILVTSFQSPLTEDEVRFLSDAAPYARGIFVVLNKHDMAPPERRSEVLAYAERVVRGLLGESARAPFSVSARDGLAAKLAGDADALRASGIEAFEQELVQFLTSEKSRIFLSGVCDRLLSALARSSAEGAEGYAREVDRLRRQIEGEAQAEADDAGDVQVSYEVERVEPCEICVAVKEKVYDFLRRYQFELASSPEAQERHAEQGGFCPLHTWHYEQVASPRGVCTAYPALLARLARTLRQMARSDSAASLSHGLPPEPRCAACRVRAEAEDRAVKSLLGRVGRAGSPTGGSVPALCMPHLRLVLRSVTDRGVARLLLEHEAACLEYVAEDMLRYALRHDALKRGLASEEERQSPLAALQMVAGLQNVNAAVSAEVIV
jgi:small GTP-binding protein